MKKPELSIVDPETYQLMKAYAEFLTEQIALTGEKPLTGDALTKKKLECCFAWRDVHEMAIAISQSYTNRAKEALNEIVRAGMV